MGALIYGPSRIGKTRAIEYVRLLLARNHPRMTSYHAQCEHKPRHAEGPFFANLLEAVGDPDPNAGTNPSKRMRLSLRIREAAARAGSGTVLLFCDEAQRYNVVQAARRLYGEYINQFKVGREAYSQRPIYKGKLLSLYSEWRREQILAKFFQKNSAAGKFNQQHLRGSPHSSRPKIDGALILLRSTR
jgi:hypothetical protein